MKSEYIRELCEGFAFELRWHPSGGQIWHPSRVRFDVGNIVPGVSLTLNPRLFSGSPSGWQGAPAGTSNNTHLSPPLRKTTRRTQRFADSSQLAEWNLPVRRSPETS